MASWNPPLRSADADLLPDIRNIVSRANDLHRNYPLASGGTQIHVDNIIGSGLRLSSKPNYRALGLDAEWAAEWSRDVEAKFRAWAEDEGCFVDAERKQTLGGLLGLGYRQYLGPGEILAVPRWIPRPGCKYSTAIQLVDPARLCNPHGMSDTATLRAGVELDKNGAMVAGHIRSALQGDERFTGTKTYEWKRIPRETRWGRSRLIHIFEPERAGQTRGKSGLASVIANSFKLGKLQDISLESTTIQAMYAAVLESDMDSEMAAETMGHGSNVTNNFLTQAGEFYGDKGVLINNARIPRLFPGDKLHFSSLNNPGPNFAEFEKSFLRNLAAGWNLSYEQLARDYSETNYSGARAGLQEAWKFFTARRELVGGRFASMIFALWLEEAFDIGEVELPKGAPSFYDAKSAYCRARWIGPGKGQIDPLKEAKADELEMDMGTLTLEDACAARGKDWEEIAEQRARRRRS